MKNKFSFMIIVVATLLASFSLKAANTCLDFDGTDDFVQSDNTVIPASGDFTVSVWAKLDGLPTSGVREILSQDAGSGGEDFYIGYENGIVRAGDDWVGNTGVSYPTDGEWHFFTVVKNSTNTFLYIDGELKATKGSTSLNPAGDIFRVARQYGVYPEYFDGQIDEVRIWNTARTEQEITDNMNHQLTGSETGLVSYYNFNEGSGDIAGDSVGDNYGSLLYFYRYWSRINWSFLFFRFLGRL